MARCSQVSPRVTASAVVGLPLLALHSSPRGGALIAKQHGLPQRRASRGWGSRPPPGAVLRNCRRRL
jgi:hypothetical protein